MTNKKKLSMAMICGILGCLCYGGGDWLMIYGDTAYAGKLMWLTQGVTQIAGWRNSLAMMLAFPGIICYGIALFYLEKAFVFKEDYKVIRNMIYGKIPEFEEILEFLQKLQEEVHELKKL